MKHCKWIDGQIKICWALFYQLKESCSQRRKKQPNAYEPLEEHIAAMEQWKGKVQPHWARNMKKLFADVIFGDFSSNNSDVSYSHISFEYTM